MRLTKAQTEMFMEAAQCGFVDIHGDERHHKPRIALQEKGLTRYDESHGDILTRKGVAEAEKRWPDMEVVALGDPFYYENCGIPDEALEVSAKMATLRDEFYRHCEAGEYKRKDQERKMYNLVAEFIQGMDIPNGVQVAIGATRTVLGDGRCGYTVSLCYNGVAGVDTRDTIRVERGAFVQDESETRDLCELFYKQVMVSLKVVGLTKPDFKPVSMERM